MPEDLNIPGDMRAFAKVGEGLPDLELLRLPVPTVGPGELLVRIEAFGVGVHDAFYLPPGVALPYVIGIEGAGEVVLAGEGAAGFVAGDRVAFVSAMQPKGGAWAEYAVVSADGLVVRIPPAMSFLEAAALPVAGNTALRAVEALELRDGETLFIAGASGAIGTIAAQVARLRGIQVAGSASPRNHDHLAALGVELAVDYADPDWPETVRTWRKPGVDAGIAVLANTTAEVMAVVRPGGRVVTVSGDSVTSDREVAVLQLPHDLDMRLPLATLFEQVADGRVKVVLDRVLPFTEALDALAQTQTYRARGKLVVDLSA